MTDDAHGPFPRAPFDQAGTDPSAQPVVGAPAPPAGPAVGAAPPAGPGVQPPFAAPPSEGRTARVWWGLGVAGLAVVLCCGVGLASFAGLVITGSAAINEQSHAAVEDYLQAVGAARYRQAYDLLCDELRDRQSLGQFTEQVSAQPRVHEYELRESRVRNNGEIVVPADVTYTNGTQTVIDYLVVQESGAIRFCGPTG